jgi:hypothetical protein
MKTNGSSQLRIRLSPAAAKHYADIPPLARSRVISFILNMHAAKVDPAELLSSRHVLVNLGTLLNQSLRTSWGKSSDAQAASELVRVLKGLTS